jgi:hypothetical protein
MKAAVLLIAFSALAAPARAEEWAFEPAGFFRGRLVPGAVAVGAGQKDEKIADSRFIAVGKPQSNKSYMKYDGHTKLMPYGTVDPTAGVICSVRDASDPWILYFGKPTVSGTSWSAIFQPGEGNVPSGGIPYRDAAYTFRLESPVGFPMVGMDTLDVPFFLKKDGADGELKRTKAEDHVKVMKQSLVVKKHLLDMVWPKPTGNDPPVYSIAEREIIAKGALFRTKHALSGMMIKEPYTGDYPIEAVVHQNGTDWTMKFSIRHATPGNYRLIVRTDSDVLMDHILVIVTN